MPGPLFPNLGYGTYGRLAPGSALSNRPRVLSAQFGGGYEQRAGDGINTNQRTLSARFENLEEAEATILDDFLDSLGGYKPFTIPVPGHGVMQFTCKDWTRTYNEVMQDTISATFVECFDP